MITYLKQEDISIGSNKEINDSSNNVGWTERSFVEVPGSDIILLSSALVAD